MVETKKKLQWNRPEGNIQTNDLTNHSFAIDSENIDLKTNQALYIKMEAQL